MVIIFECNEISQRNLQDMWTESSSVNTVNLASKFYTIPEISNFSLLLARLYIPIEFGPTGNSAIRSADPENSIPESNMMMKWIVDYSLLRYRHC